MNWLEFSNWLHYESETRLKENGEDEGRVYNIDIDGFQRCWCSFRLAKDGLALRCQNRQRLAFDDGVVC
jgi:hypothetical protein